MPELPEVETVKETLKKQVLNKTIKDVDVYYSKIIEYPGLDEFKKQIKGQKINDILRRGKWLMFKLDDYYLLSHLRMEGRYYIKHDEDILPHEHVVFHLDDCTLRYLDTRKFGRMYLEPIKDVYNIKTVLLDQTIITGIGNIYDDEILFMSHINPYRSVNTLTDTNLKDIITNTRIVLEHAIKLGGTTIRTYESSEGVHGRFQNELLVHGKEVCPICGDKITKVYINGRGTYYCETCQKD